MQCRELFGIIGKIVTESGFEDVLYQADLCTSGGIKGFFLENIIIGRGASMNAFLRHCIDCSSRENLSSYLSIRS